MDAMFHARVIGIPVAILPVDGLAGGTFDAEFLGPNIATLEVGMSVPDAQRVDTSIPVDEDVVIVERSPESVRHHPVVRPVDLFGDGASNDAVIDLSLKAAGRLRPKEEWVRREANFRRDGEVVLAFFQSLHDDF